jgi:hypothetical protein
MVESNFSHELKKIIRYRNKKLVHEDQVQEKDQEMTKKEKDNRC